MLAGMCPSVSFGAAAPPAARRRRGNARTRGGRGAAKPPRDGYVVGPAGGGTSEPQAVPSAARGSGALATPLGVSPNSSHCGVLPPYSSPQGHHSTSPPSSDGGSLLSQRAPSLGGFSLSSVPSFSVPAASLPAPTAPSVAASVASAGWDTSELRGERQSYAESTKPYPGTVHTPWVRNVPLSDGISVGDEVLAFGEFLRQTPAEVRQAEGFRSTVQGAARGLCAAATAKLVGSRCFGCPQPSSGTDVVVESFGRSPGELAAALQQTGGYQVSVDTCGCESVVTCKVEGQGDCRVFLWEGERSPQRQLSQLLRRRLEAHGGAGRAVVLVARTILRQSNLDGPARGGISGTAVAVLVASVLSSVEQELDAVVSPPRHADPSADAAAGAPGEGSATTSAVAEALLRLTLRTYGKWDWAARSVALDAFGGRAHPPSAAASVCTPFAAATNLAAGCTKPKQVSAMLEYARLALRQWEETDPSDMTRNSRGVTPLSSIVAHKDLWDRSHALRRRAAEVAASGGATSPPAAAGPLSESP